MVERRYTINPPVELANAIERKSEATTRGYSEVIVLALAQHFHVELPENYFRRGPKSGERKPREVVDAEDPLAAAPVRKTRKRKAETTADYAF